MVTFILCQSDFTTLVSMEVVFVLALYIILPVSVLKLRKKIPLEKRKERGLFFIKGGKAAMIFYAGFPMVIAVIALLINGTDYLTTGLMALCTGPVAYYILKRVYKGFTVNDPENNPINPKTRMAVGDTVRLGVFMICAGAMAFLGQFWLKWYEIDYGEWGPDDYDVFANSIPQVIECLKWIGLAVLVIGIILVLIGRKKDAPLPEKAVDIDALMDKYLNEEKHDL